MKALSLGIDTSNYKTSVALVDENDEILYDERTFLKVGKGNRGLRQQEALFQHNENLPGLIKGAFKAAEERGGEIATVSASDRPRPVEGSYMPCFNAGRSAAEIIAASLGLVPRFFSHQEGHIEAGKRYSELRSEVRFGAFHFSGGTTEALLWEEGRIEILGGTLDLSFGQVLDRIGVRLGMAFPAGEEMDKLALASTVEAPLSRIKVKDGFFNLSGIETEAERMIDRGASADEISKGLFKRFGEAIRDTMDYITKEKGIEDFLFIGGVSGSESIRDMILKGATGRSHFVGQDLSSDNAIGIALLGGDPAWR